RFLREEAPVSRRRGWPYKQEFRCHRCGNCCRGDGFVDLTETDVERASSLLEMKEDDFIDEFCRRIGEDLILLDQEDDEKSCIFLVEEDGLFGCRIHEAKPTQCAGFPFEWRPRNVADFCEG